MFGKGRASELKNAMANVSGFDAKYEFLNTFTDYIINSEFDDKLRTCRTGNLGRLYNQAYREISVYISPSKRDLCAFVSFFTTIYQELVYRHVGVMTPEFYCQQLELLVKEAPADAYRIISELNDDIAQTLKGVAELGDPVSHPERVAITPTNQVNWFIIGDYVEKMLERLGPA